MYLATLQDRSSLQETVPSFNGPIHFDPKLRQYFRVNEASPYTDPPFRLNSDSDFFLFTKFNNKENVLKSGKHRNGSNGQH